MTNWLVLNAVATAMSQASALHKPGEISASGDIHQIAGSTATINISGVMTQAPDWFAKVFGGGNVTYPEIIGALHEADADSRVSSIVIKMDSPGGTVDGLFDAMSTLAAIGKPTRVEVGNKAASAAYMLASQADEIVATSPVASFGSVGVVVDARVSDEIVSVTSSEAPNKRHDLKTEDGRATLQAELDDIHAVMAEEIAKGRGITAEEVNKNFGRGGMLIAAKAAEAGMIDATETQATSTRGGNIKATGDSNMDLNTLKAQHPETYAAAVDAGKNIERERASAHLIMGEASGDMATAMSAIEAGDEMTPLISAKYQAASMKRNAIEAREEEAAPEVAGNVETHASIEDQVVDAVCETSGAVNYD